MATVMLEQRVDSLEDLMRDLIRNGKRVDRLLEETAQQQKETAQQQKITDQLLKNLIQQQDITSREVKQLSKEMREFKDETRNEMRNFKDEMQDFKDEMKASKKIMDKRWGDLSNKMGTLVEDLVVPSIPSIFKTVTNCSEEGIISQSVRFKQRHPLNNKLQEFDAIVVSKDYVLINETKSRLTTEDIKYFKKLMLIAREFFPMYEDKKFIGAIASLYLDPSLVTHAEKQGLVVLGFMEGAMQVLNTTDFSPQYF